MAGEIYKAGSQTISAPVLAGGVTNANITTTTARPYSLDTMDVTALRLQAIDKKLQVESTLGSVFVNLGTDVVFNGKKVAIPDACVVRMSSIEKGARSQVMPIENPLAGPGRGGTAEPQQGYERTVTLEYMKIYYNEYSQGVMGETWGMNFNDLQLINYYQNEQPRLSKWFAEDEDKQYHEALLQRYSWVLEKTGTELTKAFNPNWFIANTEFASQPVYSNTAATFAANINNAFEAAASGTNGVNANISLDYLLALSYYAENQKRIKPVMIGGKPSYLVLLPAPQYHKLMQVNNGQLGSIWQNVTSLTSEEQNFPGIIGRVLNLVIVADPRYPTITCTNNYANDTFSVAYVEPGNYDVRNKTVYNVNSNVAWDIGFLMGAGAIIDWTVTPLHFAKTETEYGKIYGKAAFCERGIQMGVYDTDTASNLNAKQFSSIVLAFTGSTIVSVA